MFLDSKEHPQNKGVETCQSDDADDVEDEYENDEVSDDESVGEDMQVETVGEVDRSEGDESVIEDVLVETANEEADEIAVVPIAQENAGGPIVDEEAEENAGVPLAEENGGVPLAGIAGVPHADEADEMDATYGARTGKYNLRKRKPRSCGHLHSLTRSDTSKDGDVSLATPQMSMKGSQSI